MSRIPYVHRIDGRYIYRRRVHFRNLISKPLPVALRTADPKAARKRAAFLSARFALVKQRLDGMISANRSFLTGAEIEALFRHELEMELTQALADAYADASYSAAIGEAASPLAEAYRIARRPDRPRTLSTEDRTRLLEQGLDACDVHQVQEYLQHYCHEAGLSDDEVRSRLAAIDAPTSDPILAIARGHLLRARADAWQRATRIFDNEIVDTPNPLRALVELTSRSSLPEPTQGASMAIAPGATSNPECPFLVYDRRRFCDAIDDIIAQLRSEKVWKGDCTQQRRIMATFGWISGNKELGAYNHLDVDAFKRGLMQLPKIFRFGSSEEGAMSQPFGEVLAKLPPLKPAEERNAKTINRDLSTMSTVSKHLAQTCWKPRTPNTLVLDFAAATVSVRDTGDDPRPPWTKEHLQCLFQSPIWTGGGGGKKRLRTDGPVQNVWHDAAYFAPLLWYYHHACREEICGLRVDEVVLSHPVPHFKIQDNDVRGRDGELAGEKRLARRRILPIHPELLRLNFANYVRAIEREGHTALFPELYRFSEKRGGGWFYDRAWIFMVQWIEDRMEVPRNRSGKGPDIHSIRSLGSSFYEVDGVNEIMRADVMGHARSGTNAKHYSKRASTEGLEVLLKERLEFLQRYVPIITKQISPKHIRLLPLELRSRAGSGRYRKVRSDKGDARALIDRERR